MRAGADDATLGQIIDGVWQKRADRYSELRSVTGAPEREKIQMYYIGG